MGNMEAVSTAVLVGNTFPLTLVRGWKVEIEEVGAEALRGALASGAAVRSFWGHAETQGAAEAFLGVATGTLTPRVPRPALRLGSEGLPELDGERFAECHVLSPDVAGGGRPAPGQAAAPSAITGWHVLRLRWVARI